MSGAPNPAQRPNGPAPGSSHRSATGTSHRPARETTRPRTTSGPATRRPQRPTPCEARRRPSPPAKCLRAKCPPAKCLRAKSHGPHARRLVVACLIALATTLSSCRTRPTIEVGTEAPPGTRILLNGRVVAADSWRADLPYYGALDFEARPAPAPIGPDLKPEYQPARSRVDVPPPASRLLFPLDFVVELVGAPWRDWQTTTVLTTVEREPAPAGIVPPRLEELRERARAMRTER